MPRTLLLADDSLTIQRVIELTFADEDIRVIAVSDGQQAIERIEAEKPDIVLADIGMPNRDGYEVAGHVKASPHLRHIPVLLLTGAFEPVDDARASAVGCDGVLAKPFEPQVVINRVKDLLAGRSRRDEHSPTHPSGGSVPDASILESTAGRPERQPVPQPLPGADDTSIAAGQGWQSASTTAATPTPLSLDEYFDQLDAALGRANQVFRGAAETGRAVGDTPASPVPPRVTPPPAVMPPAALMPAMPPAPAPAVDAETAVSLGPAATPEPVTPMAAAFSTLLAAEQAEAIPAAARLPLRALVPALAEPSDEVIEQIVRRVLDRLADREFVSDVVSQVTERIVREEIERLKAVLRQA